MRKIRANNVTMMICGAFMFLVGLFLTLSANRYSPDSHSTDMALIENLNSLLTSVTIIEARVSRLEKRLDEMNTKD